MELPPIPAPVAHFIPYIDGHPDHKIRELLAPYKGYESKLRELYAQHPDSALIADPFVNTTPVFGEHGNSLKIRARRITSETENEAEKYILPLPNYERKPNGSPAMVASLKDFQTNFNLFSESSLVDLDWSNVVAAGSSVVTALLPVNAPHNESRRALRSYYHEKLAPASDVDLFLYGLDEMEAVEKIRQIEGKIRDSILAETTTIRTKNAITIVSEYPTRHVQIVLRLYKTVSEILTGFDIDCSCVAYDGEQVWAAPRAVAAFMTQINTVDLTRRSPSYENRLSKYSHRGFEVYCAELDRARVDPTIFERSFSRVMGLARLLVLEKLPHPGDRDAYLAKRRTERGRPALSQNYRNRYKLQGNIKDSQPDDIAEWVVEDEVSNYHTFTIPYGPKYNAKKIEKLLFTKDLLLNAEWNRSDNRETILHRHPAFFGSIQDVIYDCCGSCPEPKTDEDLVALEKEEKIYLLGDIKFIINDPGRQTIGSFHPIEDSEWAEMAYVGNTARLCQAIVDCDLEHVQDWLLGEDVDVNRRDHTGRTPLILASMCSTSEIVQCLIKHGARIVARIFNGMTALHVAAHRGNTAIVKALLIQSEANEAEEAAKKDGRIEARRVLRAGMIVSSALDGEDEAGNKPGPSNSDSEDLVEDDDSDDSDRMTEGSFIKIKATAEEDAIAKADDDDEPDIYDIAVLAWDSPLSPLHLAILGGHLDTIELLIDNFGADALLPVKLMNESKAPWAAILTTTLALQLPLDEANKTIKLLLSKGASSAQADMNQASALHYAVVHGKALILETLFDSDSLAAKRAINHIVVSGYHGNARIDTPLQTAIRKRDMEMVDILISKGANTEIDYESFVVAYNQKFDHQNHVDLKRLYEKTVSQPIVEAVRAELPDLVETLLKKGIDCNTQPAEAYQRAEYPDRTYYGTDHSLLDIVRSKLKDFNDFLSANQIPENACAPEPLEADEHYLKDLSPGSYSHWVAVHDLEQARVVKQVQLDFIEKSRMDEEMTRKAKGFAEKVQAVKLLAKAFTRVVDLLLKGGAKTFYELYPNIWEPNERVNRNREKPNEKREPYATRLYYQGDPLLTEERARSYTRLFEAAWTGDVDTVKLLTLGGLETGGCPLKVAIKDLRGFSPFSVAVIRGHRQLALTILEICAAQFQPDNVKRYRYILDSDNAYENNCDESNLGGSEEPSVKIRAELLDDTFTIDDITQLASSVKSKVSPMQLAFSYQAELWRAPHEDQMGTDSQSSLLRPRYFPYSLDGKPSHSWDWFFQFFDTGHRHYHSSLISYAISKNDRALLKFLLQTGADLVVRQEDKNALKLFQLDSCEFNRAAALGRVEMIGDIISMTGAAIPLQKLMEKSGLQLQEKPRYYQGLSVHGKKRADWVAAGRGATRARSPEDTSPLLDAIFQGNLETVEMFLTDAPLRRYKEFAEAHKTDKHIQALTEAPGGIDKALSTWLGRNTDMAIHVAVLFKQMNEDDASHEILGFLLRTMPDIMDVKDKSGSTPLQNALEMRRFYAAKKLIDAGANQATRDSVGKNLLHTIICKMDGTFGADARLFRSLMALFDESLLKAMVLERCGGNKPGGQTPMALYLAECPSDGRDGPEKILDVLLEYSNGKDLEIMDGAGDYPLHSLVRRGAHKLIRHVIRYNPDLLHRENATGMTPLEVIEASQLRSLIDSPPSIGAFNWTYYDHHNKTWILEKPVSEFVAKTPEESAREVTEAEDWKTWTQPAAPRKRKLVSLFDANEVAKRLADEQKRKAEEDRRYQERRREDKAARNRYPWKEEEEKDELAVFKKHTNTIGWDEQVWQREVCQSDLWKTWLKQKADGENSKEVVVLSMMLPTKPRP